ncbi:MAG: polysaccharide deacetylase family protein [Bacteriovoracaceae bacterium]
MKFLYSISIFCSLSAWSACDFLSHKELGKEIFDEIQKENLNCNKQQIHLTFDDGPSPTVTPQILEELNKRKIKATFFITTTNLNKGHPQAITNRQLVMQEYKEGHLIGNHGFEHAAYDLRLKDGMVIEKGFNQEERNDQIRKSINLLDVATNGKFSSQEVKLFRFPYGRGALPSSQEINYMIENKFYLSHANDYTDRLREYRQQSPALKSILENGLGHLGWNLDSGDSSLGKLNLDQESTKKYIIKNLKEMCRPSNSPKIALFHDIKPINAISIPVMIDVGQCLGMKFISPQQMLAEKSKIIQDSVLIEAPEKQLQEILSKFNQDELIETKDCHPPEKEKCFSEQYQKYYEDCQGGDSICFNGKFYSRSHPQILLNCSLATK